jgi:hypothetical protein
MPYVCNACIVGLVRVVDEIVMVDGVAIGKGEVDAINTVRGYSVVHDGVAAGPGEVDAVPSVRGNVVVRDGVAAGGLEADAILSVRGDVVVGDNVEGAGIKLDAHLVVRYGVVVDDITAGGGKVYTKGVRVCSVVDNCVIIAGGAEEDAIVIAIYDVVDYDVTTRRIKTDTVASV